MAGGWRDLILPPFRHMFKQLGTVGVSSTTCAELGEASASQPACASVHIT